MQWLIAALLLCEWRAAPPKPLSIEQWSARSAIGIKRCRKIAACADSSTYLASSLGPGEILRRWPDDGLPITEVAGAGLVAAALAEVARDLIERLEEAP